MSLKPKRQPSDLIKEIEKEKIARNMIDVQPPTHIAHNFALDKAIDLIQNSGWISPPQLADEIEKVHAEYRRKARKPVTMQGDELVKRLAELYNKNYIAVALVCDEALDKSGALLGEVRKKAGRPK